MDIQYLVKVEENVMSVLSIFLKSKKSLMSTSDIQVLFLIQ